jgi:hypothetical protein
MAHQYDLHPGDKVSAGAQERAEWQRMDAKKPRLRGASWSFAIQSPALTGLFHLLMAVFHSESGMTKPHLFSQMGF